MFETLYSRPGVLRRHREAPLAPEREAYLKELAAKGFAHETLLRRARYVRCVAVELGLYLPDQSFTVTEIRTLAREWAVRRDSGKRPTSPRGAAENFRRVATDFLRSIGRLRPVPSAEDLSEFDPMLDEFVAVQREFGWQAEATCRAGRWQIQRFLAYLKRRSIDLNEVSAKDIDAFYKQVSTRWNRSSLKRSASVLRKWFKYGEKRGWSRPGLAALIETPRIYRDEGLPLGPAWETVGRMLTTTVGDAVGAVRDRAILLLLSVYGLRSGEVRRLRLDDLDWAGDRIRFERSKSRRAEEAPLLSAVGEAIARYVSRHRPLSQGGLHHLVARHYPAGEAPRKGRGLHGLRHACARHLIESGHTSYRSRTISVIAASAAPACTPRSTWVRSAKWPSRILEVWHDSPRSHRFLPRTQALPRVQLFGRRAHPPVVWTGDGRYRPQCDPPRRRPRVLSRQRATNPMAGTQTLRSPGLFQAPVRSRADRHLSPDGASTAHPTFLPSPHLLPAGAGTAPPGHGDPRKRRGSAPPGNLPNAPARALRSRGCDRARDCACAAATWTSTRACSGSGTRNSSSPGWCRSEPPSIRRSPPTFVPAVPCPCRPDSVRSSSPHPEAEPFLSPHWRRRGSGSASTPTFATRHWPAGSHACMTCATLSPSTGSWLGTVKAPTCKLGYLGCRPIWVMPISPARRPTSP